MAEESEEIDFASFFDINQAVEEITPTPIPTYTPLVKVPFVPEPINEVKFVDRAWCYDLFPLWFLIATYLLTCFVAGVSIMGAIYEVYYRNVPTMTTDKKETFHNKLLGKQTTIIIMCCIYLACSLIVAIAGLLHLSIDTFCGHVPIFVIFFILCLLTAIYLVLRHGTAWWKARNEKLKELERIQQEVEREYRALAKTKVTGIKYW
eukprot:TRINITY_DN37498_c0_g1_i1.p1 TRINITY_DN37498_c0_g1~~TRINITY_DN37498_c0_g1_i1.p1  ORF type:complete len:215 (+),score=21.36 TRINITY_DN37498_c0_g1_i1:30-647(+)